jgi:hypothetical protein
MVLHRLSTLRSWGEAQRFRAFFYPRRPAADAMGSESEPLCAASWAGLTQAYVNLKKVLADYGATLDLLVEEVLYVTDMDAAFGRGEVRKQAYSGRPVVASTILVTPRLALPDQLIMPCRRWLPSSDHLDGRCSKACGRTRASSD